MARYQTKILYTTPKLLYIVLVYGSDLNLHRHKTYDKPKK